MPTRMYNQEFTEKGSSEGNSENGMSVEYVKFMEILKDGTEMGNKHYQIPMPFRNASIQLPNNRYQTWQRLSYLLKRFNRNKEFDHVRFMEEIISK